MEPQVQPPMPVQPTSQPMQTQPAPVMQPKKSKKGLIIGLSVGGGVLLLGLAGLISWLLIFNVTAEDYTKAQTALSDVKDSYQKVKSSYEKYVTYAMSGSYGAAQLNTERSTLDKNLSAYNGKLDGLKDLKALKSGDIKSRYEAFLSNSQKAIATVNDTLSSHDPLLSSATSCSGEQGDIDYSDKSVIVTSYDNALGGCIKDLKELSKAKQSDLASYGSKMYDLYNEQRMLIQNLQDAYNAKDQTKYNDAASKVVEQANKFSDTMKDVKVLMNALKEKSDSADGTLGELQSAVDKKVNK